MITRQTIKHVLGVAMLFDDHKRFDTWTGDEAKEFVEIIANAILAAELAKPQTAATTLACEYSLLTTALDKAREVMEPLAKWWDGKSNPRKGAMISEKILQWIGLHAAAWLEEFPKETK